jgi:tRNA (guanine-N7-)-methyltransferase
MEGLRLAARPALWTRSMPPCLQCRPGLSADLGPLHCSTDMTSSSAPESESTLPEPTATGDAKPYMRTVKSFVKRAGRMGGGQIKAVEELGPKFLFPYQTSAIDFEAAYADSTGATGQNGLKNPVVLEIGFGMGEATAHIAKVLPETRFLCCEVHEAGVGALLKRIGEQDIHNIRICNHDAVEVIDHMLPLGSLDGVHIFFPDPWHKTKHNKRRLIQSPLVAKLAARIKVGGYLHCATDWEPYAQQMLEVLSAEPKLKNRALATHPELAGYAPKPHYRPLTKFENRGIKLGHGVWDLVFERV